MHGETSARGASPPPPPRVFPPGAEAWGLPPFAASFGRAGSPPAYSFGLCVPVDAGRFSLAFGLLAALVASAPTPWRLANPWDFLFKGLSSLGRAGRLFWHSFRRFG